MAPILGHAGQNLALPGRFGERIQVRPKEQRAFGDPRRPRAGGNGSERFLVSNRDVHPARDRPVFFEDGPVIGNRTRIHLHAVEHRIEKLLIPLGAPRLSGGFVRIGDHERIDGLRSEVLSAEDLRHPVVKQGCRRPVGDDVVHVAQKHHAIAAGAHLEPEQRTALEIERLRKGGDELVCGGRGFFRDRHVDRAIGVVDERGYAVFLRGMHAHEWVFPDHGDNGVAQTPPVDIPIGFEQKAHRVVVHEPFGIARTLEVHAELAVGHRVSLALDAQRIQISVQTRFLLALAELRGNRTRRSPPEHVLRRKRILRKLCLEHDDLDRIAAEREEIIVDSHVLDAENRCEGLADPLLLCRFGGNVGLTERRGVGSLQALAVDLAVDVERERFETNQKSGNHVIGHLGREFRPDERVEFRIRSARLLLGHVVSA